MAVHCLEIVSDDVDALTTLYQRTHGLSFGPPDPDLGQARVATRADGTLVGTVVVIRAPASCMPGSSPIGDRAAMRFRHPREVPRIC